MKLAAAKHVLFTQCEDIYAFVVQCFEYKDQKI